MLVSLIQPSSMAAAMLWRGMAASPQVPPQSQCQPGDTHSTCLGTDAVEAEQLLQLRIKLMVSYYKLHPKSTLPAALK